jgi:hypothetical protein
MPITEGGRFTPNDRIVSPGVFSRENDLSGIAQGVADIGGVVVAPFAKGPGFSPTVCNSVAELEAKFGVADGTLYGPYTAKQYLQEKGFVTVCRVGALTGYHQSYPWVIWAEKGTYLRNADAAWLNPTSSFVQVSGLTFKTYMSDYSETSQSEYQVTGSGNLPSHITTSFSHSYYGDFKAGASLISTITSSSFDVPGSELTTSYTWNYYGASYTGSVEFNNQPISITFMPGAAVANESDEIGGFVPSISGSVPHSGSVLYNNQIIQGYISGVFQFTGSLNVMTASATSASLFNALFTQKLFVGEIKNAIFNTASVSNPFNTAYFDTSPIPVYISQSIGNCDLQNLNLFGFFSGSIGAYNGGFQGGIGTFDPCTGLWTMTNTEYKVLAVLADTMFAGVSTTLHAPGFLGSTQSISPSISGLSTVGLEYDLYLTQSADGGYGKYHFSLDPNSIQYITNVFGKDPRVGDPAKYAQGTKVEAGYLYSIFEDDIAKVASEPTKWRINGTPMPSGSWEGEALNFTDAYSLDLLNGDSQYGLTNAYTPWIVSQQISAWNGGTSTRFPLFKLWTLSDGTYTNTSYKIEISNIKLAGTVAGSDWGTFTLTVRDYSDTDKKVKIMEQFNNLTLDPTSPNFVARRIGDRYNYIRFDGKIIEFGTYDNLSNYIRIVMTPNPYPVTAVPYGFQAYTVPVNGAIGFWCNPMAYTKASVYSLFPGKYPSGIDFGGFPSGADAELTALYPTSSTGIEHWRDNLQYFAPVPAGASIGSGSIFALDEEIIANGVIVENNNYFSASNAVPATYVNAASETVYVKMRKFIFGFQGGFDGQSPAIAVNLGGDIVAGNTQGLNCDNSTTAGSIAYKQCIGALGNADEFDINLIVTPGIVYSLHSYVTNLVVEMCETRGDCFYILDMYADGGNPATGQIDEVVNLANEFDTSYAGTYYPWVKIKDTNTNQIVTVPPSVVMPGIYAANDRVAGEWWAVAGLNRGGITQAVQVTDRTTHTERDTLYEGRVNPIAAFPGQGIVAWGQKTLQVKASALDRINVRRLLIEIKKFFASTARYLVFEQNTAATRNKFLAIVNPYLESVQQRSGLYAFQVVMDESNNTPDLVDRNILYGQIWLKPTKTAEFIVLDFNVLPTGAAFPSA